jgi:AraC-like DNA-binding protein
LLGRAVDRLDRALRSLDDEAAAFALCDALRALSPRLDVDAAHAGAIVRAIETDHAITRVAEVSERSGIAALALQRLFRNKIGVSPKWVIQRYRLHEALERRSLGRRSIGGARLQRSGALRSDLSPVHRNIARPLRSRLRVIVA